MPRGVYDRTRSKEDSAMTDRPNPRPEMREDDPRARAAARAAALREHGDDLMDDGQDDFYVEPGAIPDGWDYEWKVQTVLGAEDPARQVQIARGGWEPVPASRHPAYMPHGYKGKTIERKGMVLMERPKEITDDIRKRDLKRARQQVRAKEEQLNGAPEGHFERVDQYGKPTAKIKHSHEAMAIPE